MNSTFEFGQFAPDAPIYGGEHCTIARNVVRRGGAYRSLRGFGGASLGSIPQRALSGTTALARDGGLEVFIGGSSRLYWRSAPRVFTDVSPIGSAFTPPLDFGWSWAQFGMRVIASNVVDGAYKFDIGVDARFAALANAPAGKTLALIGDHLMMGDVREGATRIPNRVRWSGFNNTEIWGSDFANQSDFQDLDPAYGAVQAVIGGDYSTVFQSRAVTRVTRIGGDLVFSFQLVDRERGAWAGRSVIRVGSLIFYLAQDGFYVFDGSSSRPIGVGRVDKWALGQMSAAQREQLRAAHDPAEACVCWCWPIYPQPSGANPLAPASMILRYAYLEDRWTYQIDTSPRGAVIFSGGAQSSAGVDDSATALADADTLIDEADAARDDQVLIALDYDGAATNAFAPNGSWLPAELHTAVQALSPRSRVLVTGGRALIDAVPPGNVIIGVAAQESNLQSPPGVFAEASPNNTGFAPFRKSGRYFRARLGTQVDTSFSAAQGVDLVYTQQGQR